MRLALGLAAGLALAATNLTAAQAGSGPLQPTDPTSSVSDPSHKPKKGVIYIKTKKFTSCSSWGKDKNFCKGGK
jgi:hypothetical protein